MTAALFDFIEQRDRTRLMGPLQDHFLFPARMRAPKQATVAQPRATGERDVYGVPDRGLTADTAKSAGTR